MCKSTSKLETSSYWFHINCTSFTVSVEKREDCKCWSVQSPINVPFSKQGICGHSVSWIAVPALSWCCSISLTGCPALLCLFLGMGLTGCHHPLSPGVPNPLCTWPSPASVSHPAWGSALHLGCQAAKTLPDQTLPLLPTPWKCFIPTISSHSSLCCFRARSVWTLLKPAGQELFFLKGLIFHCR